MQELKPISFVACQKFVCYILLKMECDVNWLTVCFMRRRGTFFSVKKLESAKLLHSGKENPHELVEKLLHDINVTMWYGVTSFTYNRKKKLHCVIFLFFEAACHVAYRVMTILRSTFVNTYALSHTLQHECPPRSLDLTPCYFLLKVCVKYHAYRD